MRRPRRAAVGVLSPRRALKLGKFRRRACLRLIPLPGTGAWTGSLVAALLHMKFGKAIGAILIGIIMATVIMSLLSYGLLGALFA